MLNRSIPGSLLFCSEIAGWKLVSLSMVGNAITTDPFSVTGFVGAIAAFQVVIFFAVHGAFLLLA